MKTKRHDGRFNGLQDFVPDSVAPGQFRSPEECATLNNAPPRSKWTDVDHSNNSMDSPQQQSGPQQYSNKNAQDHLWQEMQRRDQAHLLASQPKHNPILHPTPRQLKTASASGNQVTNGLPDPEDRKQTKPFNVKTSASLANAVNVNLQQSSMANGLLQNQQQRHQAALDNTWSGQVQEQAMNGTGDCAPVNEEQYQPPQAQEQCQHGQHNFEIIGSQEPGKAPQYVLRNPNVIPQRQQIYTGFPSQFPTEQQCLNTNSMIHPSMMQSEMMMQPGEIMQQGGLMQPGGMLQQGGLMQPGGMLQQGGLMQPGGMLQQGGLMQPGGMLQHGGGIVQGGTIPPGAIMKDGSKVPPGTIIQSGGVGQLPGLQGGMMMPQPQMMPQTMPPNMASEIMPHGHNVQPTSTYQYGYSSPNPNYSYQPYTAYHGMHG